MRLSSLSLVIVFALVPAIANGQVVPHAEAKTPDMKKGAQLLGGKTLYDWMNVLKKETDPGNRVRAINALQYYGVEAREAIPLILKALRDSDASVRVNAVIAVGMIGLDAKDLAEGVNDLKNILMNPQREEGIVKFQAARTLGKLGPDAAPAIPGLLLAIRSQVCYEIRQAAAYALGSAGWDSQRGPDVRAINALLYALQQDKNADVRMEALFSLIVLGPPMQGNEKAAERRALEAHVSHDKSKIVQIWARVALMRLDKVSAHYLEPIAKLLKDPDMRVRMNAARAFAIMGKDAKGNVRDLVYALDDKEPEVLVWVCLALGEMRDAGQEALTKLEALAEHQDARVKHAAAEAIGKIKAKAKSS
jgi:HEAT repeat protein